jgi:hypothetical protein
VVAAVVGVGKLVMLVKSRKAIGGRDYSSVAGTLNDLQDREVGHSRQRPRYKEKVKIRAKADDGEDGLAILETKLNGLVFGGRRRNVEAPPPRWKGPIQDAL